MQTEFVKGHCGWDALTLVPEGRIPPGQELEAALKIIDAPLNGGLEAGLLGKGNAPDEITLRLTDSTSRAWLPMCGGMTQVVGKALVETFFRDHFDIDVSAPRLAVKLMTPSGPIPLLIDIEKRKARKVTTVMDSYAAFLYSDGVEPLTLQGCAALRVGGFLVLQVEALERARPGLDFTRRDPGPHLDFIHEILKEHMRREKSNGAHCLMYDARPQAGGQFRLYPRFYSPDLAAARLPYEFQCGTGTVAVGVAIAHHGQLPFSQETGSILCEWGNQGVTPDPYGVRTSQLDLSLKNGRVAKASFSHSVIEILAEGRITLPEYQPR